MSCVRSLAPLPLLALLACGGQQSDTPKATANSAAVRAPSVLTTRATPAPKDRLANFDARSEHVSAELRKPTIEWAAERSTARKLAAAAAAPRTAAEAARSYLGLSSGQAKASAVAGGALDDTVLDRVHDTGRGALVVQFKRQVGGLDVFGERTSVVLTRDLRPVSRSGADASTAGKARTLRPFTLGSAAAIAAAIGDVTGDAYGAGDLATVAAKGDWAQADLAKATADARGVRLVAPAGARKLLFPLAGELVPAYQVQVQLRRAGGPLQAFGYVISADDGSVLFRRNQVQNEAFTYRVWADPETGVPYNGPTGVAATPHPTGVPDGYQPDALPAQLVTLQNYTFSKNDPWLPPGAENTVGNNVVAGADWGNGDGIDLVSWTNAPGSFDWGAYSFAMEPNYPVAAQVYTAINQLFYVNNFLHDWFYDSGFDEVSGNAQASNYERGGVEGDPLDAQAQDFSGTDNANMMTPPDGYSPRMQMYLWHGNSRYQLDVTAPEAIAGTYEARVASFGPTDYDLTQAVVLADPINGCTTGGAALANAAAVAGKIALINRGGCYFDDKVYAAQQAGAAGVIIRDMADSSPVPGMGAGTGWAIAIPAMLVSYDTGVALGGQLEAGVNARLYHQYVPMRDGTIDNLVVAHEWGHFISNRLVGDALGLNPPQSGALGEGWGDTHALLLAVREKDALVEANAGWAGTYGLSGWVAGGVEGNGDGNQGYYFGIRRVPYSTDMQKNPLTFRHIADGQALVGEGSTIPLNDNGIENSEVHNAGEVWATVLWECYAALLRDTQEGSPRPLTFGDAQGRWKSYLVAAYKATPLDPTFLDARDALLSVAYANDTRDYALFWQAFAKRGMGSYAAGPDKWTGFDNNPVVESFVADPHFSVASATLASAEGTCTDGDGYLDAGETGTLTVQLRNDGAVDLPETTATPSGTGLSFPGGAVTIPASTRNQVVSVTIPVALADTSSATDATLVLTTAAGELASTTVEVPLSVNRDAIATASRFETFRGLEVPWTVDGEVDGQPGWVRSGHTMWSKSPGGVSDLRLVSPDLVVGDGTFIITVGHRYLFEYQRVGPTEYEFYDGGVMEITEDGGATWTDIETAASADVYPYDFLKFKLYDDPEAPAESKNPLAGRNAFLGNNPSYPGYDSTSVNLGTKYAGKTVRIRFRSGSDLYTGWAGWTINSVIVTGTTNSPFTLMKVDAGTCAAKSSIAGKSGGSSCSTAGGSLSAAWLLLAGAALTLRLRRRRAQ